MTAVSPSRPARGRRATRPSGDDRELAILETAERLLKDRSLAEISVDDLAKGAGISRPTFYFYFASKDAVLLTLWERVIREADTALEALSIGSAEGRDVWRPGIKVFFDTFGAHSGVTVAASGSDNADVRRVFSTFMHKWIDFTAATIEAERKRGAAPVTGWKAPPPRAGGHATTCAPFIVTFADAPSVLCMRSAGRPWKSRESKGLVMGEV